MFIQIPVRTSDCVEVMYVDPIRAIVQVAYTKGNIYEYTHVSRRVNDNLLPYDCKTRLFGKCKSLPCISAGAMPVAA